MHRFERAEEIEKMRAHWNYTERETEGVNALCSFLVALANIGVFPRHMQDDIMWSHVRDFSKQHEVYKLVLLTDEQLAQGV